jgi:hypothetical protein
MSRTVAGLIFAGAMLLGAVVLVQVLSDGFQSRAMDQQHAKQASQADEL